MTRNTDADAILRQLLYQLKAEPRAIDWSECARLGHQRGKVSVDGVPIVIRDPYEAGSYTVCLGVTRYVPDTENIWLVTSSANGMVPERRVPLAASSSLLRWRVKCAVEASFRDFTDRREHTKEYEDQQAVQDAAQKIRMRHQERPAMKVSGAGQALG